MKCQTTTASKEKVFSSRDGFKGMRWLRQTLRKHVCATAETIQMTTVRWTVRSVDPAIVDRVRSVQDRTGAGLGEIVTLAIGYGIGATHTELAQRRPPQPDSHPERGSRTSRCRDLFGLVRARCLGDVPGSR